jgi:hypothetical protein
VSPDDYLLLAPEIREGDVLIAVTQSCDILNSGSESEPHIEVLVARRIAKVHGRFTHGKHPRRYNLTCACGEDHRYEIGVRDRNFIKRSALDHCKILNCELHPQLVRNLAFWHGRRYFRSAFPTGFDRRIDSRTRAKLHALLEGTHSLFMGIYFDLDPRKEILEDEEYNLKIYMVVDPEKMKNPSIRDEVSNIATQFESTLSSCPGINIPECEPVAADGLDLYTVSNSISFDQFDFLSTPEEEN